MKILVVDDEKVQMESLKRGLRIVGYDTGEASSGEEALLQLADPHSGFGIILTDYSMPGMNGLDLLKKIRERSKSLPVIMMTAYGEKSLIIEALRNQCDSFIEKPFTTDELVREIERARLHSLHNTNSHELAASLPKLVHQISNPLTAIMGCAELGKLRLADEEKMKEYLDSILEATGKIRAINRQISNLGKFHEEAIGTVDINRLVEDCLAMFRDLITLKRILLEKDLGSTALYVPGYRDGIEQALTNLILNAIDSMDGKPLKSLKVKTEADKGGSFISICIEDTGCGIPEDALDKVFDSYFTCKQNGTGLGLAVTKEMVEKHGGKIVVESKVDSGTTFRVMLPTLGRTREKFEEAA